MIQLAKHGGMQRYHPAGLGVVQGVGDGRPVAPRRNDTITPQTRQLLTDSRLPRNQQDFQFCDGFSPSTREHSIIISLPSCASALSRDAALCAGENRALMPGFAEGPAKPDVVMAYSLRHQGPDPKGGHGRCLRRKSSPNPVNTGGAGYGRRYGGQRWAICAMHQHRNLPSAALRGLFA